MLACNKYGDDALTFGLGPKPFIPFYSFYDSFYYAYIAPCVRSARERRLFRLKRLETPFPPPLLLFSIY